MRIHHLNCGSLRQVQPPAHLRLRALPVVCHCLLVETESDGLVLVDTGLGTADIVAPEQSLGSDFLAWAQPALDPDETAVRQIRRLGFAGNDVRHVLVTHLHRDHTGGLPDFPNATVHVSQAEFATAVTNRRYPNQGHWAHGPHWVTYADGGGFGWNGFANARPPEGLSADLLLIPLRGHTLGHTAVAVRAGLGWLLHAGDAYYYRGEVRGRSAETPEALVSAQARVEADRAVRIANVDRLRRLVDDPSAEVDVFSAHDPWEFQWHSAQ